MSKNKNIVWNGQKKFCSSVQAEFQLIQTTMIVHKTYIQPPLLNDNNNNNFSNFM